MLPASIIFYFTCILLLIGTSDSAEPKAADSAEPKAGMKMYKCYQCNATSEGCAESPKEEYNRPCPKGSMGCRKILQTFEFNDGDSEEIRVFRQCVKTQSAPGCTKRFGTNGNQLRIDECECRTDGCNAGNPRAQFWSCETLLVFSGILGLLMHLVV